mgnify:FL=1
MRVNPLFLTEPSFFRYTAPKGAIYMNYTIKKVSEMTGLSIPTIRYYDKEGLLPDLQRKESGYRVFSDRDLEAIDLIECFKESGLTIREIRHFMSLVRQGDVTLEERLAIYQMHIARLEEKLTAVQNALEHSRRTLAFYEIAAKTGSEETAKDLYLARYGEAER